MEKILAVMRTQQRKAGLKTEYRFQRKAANPVDSLPNDGYGHPAKPCGLIASAFRPSDDATAFPFLVPSNFMAVDALRRAATVLDEANGSYGGVGSPHTGIDMFWPLSCIVRALTTDNRAEIADSLEIIKKVDFGTGFIHEGVDMSDPGKYTRHWFGWANALFGELMVKLVESGYFNSR